MNSTPPAQAGSGLADGPQRHRAVDPSSSFHLEAPAGSGKTSLLTARFLRLLSTVDHPRQILALTFTNKAAGEMRERVRVTLARAAGGWEPSNPYDVEALDWATAALKRHGRCRDLLMGGEYVQIQTFHSFCFALVCQAPLEAGIIPGSTLLVETDQAVLLRDTIDTTLREVLERAVHDPWRRAAEDRLLYLNNSWPVLARELEEIMQRREALGELIGVLNRENAETSFLAGLRELVEAEAGILTTTFGRTPLAASWGGFLEDLRRNGGSAAAVLPERLPGTAWEDLPEWLAMAETLLTRGGEPRKRVGPATGFYSGFAKSRWFEAVRDIPSVVAERLHAVRELPLCDAAAPDVEALWDLVLLVHAVAGAYEERCRQLHVMDFSALETAALRLFESIHPTDLQLLLDEQIRHVLVDEFQDTSRQQWLLLRRLCGGWTPGDGRTLFVVGDPKQSIYGFRKAEVGLFMEAARGLPLESSVLLPLENLTLRTNFRSTPGLIGWCNHLFGKTVMADPREELDEVRFVEASPPGGEGRGAGGKDESGGIGQPAEGPDLALFARWPDAPSARAREATWIARSVSAELAEQPAGGDRTIGILLFARTHLPTYLEALSDAKVVVQVAEGLKLTERPEVSYLWQLCRALALPHDHLAWAAQLRSPWLSLDYDGILAVSRQEPGPWVEKIRAYARENEEVQTFWENLREARQHLGREPLADVVESAWLSLGGVRLTAARWGGRGIACCRRFLDLVRAAEVNEPIQTVKRVEELIEDVFEPVEPDAASSRIHVMTVHRAKGLEFDSVYLPFMDWNPLARERAAKPPYLLERGMLASGRYLLAVRPDRREGEADPVYRRLQKLRLGRRWGEARRLFYVAATRARSRLRMSGLLPTGREGSEPSFPTESVLSWLDDCYRLGEALDFPSRTLGSGDVSGEVSRWRMEWKAPDDGFRVVVEPPVPPPAAIIPAEPPLAVLHPASFERERTSFKVVLPSGLGGTGVEPPTDGEAEAVLRETRHFAGPDPRILGVLVHRLLECCGRRQDLPLLKGIADLARHEGAADGEEASSLARLALAEVAACLDDPLLREFFRLPGNRLLAEQPVEAIRSPKTLLSGVVDLAAFHENRWRLVDFKTSRSSVGEGPEMFCRRESRKYWPQLRAYRHMWAKTKGIAEAEVDAAIFWTAYGLWERLPEGSTASPSEASGPSWETTSWSGDP